MQIRFPNILDRVRYLAFISQKVLVTRFVKKMLSPVYRHEVGHVTLRDRESFSFDRYLDDKHTEGVVIGSEQELKAWKDHIPELIPFKKLLRHLLENQHNLVILATRPTSNGKSRDVIGFRYAERGIFYFQGFKKQLSEDVLFIWHTEVLPAFRGQYVNRVMMDATHDYCLKNEIQKTIGAISLHNTPSMKHHVRWKGGDLIGKIEIKCWFNCIYRCNPP